MGEIVKPTRIAGIAEMIGPTIGTISKMPATKASGRAKGICRIVRPTNVRMPTTKDKVIWPLTHAPKPVSTLAIMLVTFFSCLPEKGETIYFTKFFNFKSK